MLTKDITNALSKKKVFVFDFDSTLANTEDYSWIAHNRALEKYGITLTDEHIKRYIGSNDEVIFSKIKEEFKIEFDSQKHLVERLAIYLNLVKENNLKCFNYFTQILKIFPDTEFYILSGSKEIVIRQILNIWQLDNRFKKVISVFDLKISKKEVLIS